MSGNSNSYSPTHARGTLNPAEDSRGQSRPEHRFHRDSESLPGSNSMAYGQDQLKDKGVWENREGTSVHHTFIGHSNAYPSLSIRLSVLIVSHRL